VRTLLALALVGIGGMSALPVPAGGAAGPPGPLPISLAEYRARLTAIASSLRTDPAAARAAASRLLAARIAAGNGALAPDRSVLGPLARGARGVELNRAAVRLAVLLATLPVPLESPPAGGARTGGRGDRELLARLAAEQALPDLPRGGELPQIRDTGALQAVADFFAPVRRWLADHWKKLWRWLRRAFTRRGREGGAEVDLPRLVTVLALLLAASFALLGLLALRRRGVPVPAVVPPAASPSPPPRDDDPLSRRAGEWEAYARELAAAGRFREAIRAWYHAVLVALYQRGILHHRKGRTNWEYVAAVPPEAAWRPAFVAVTRRFEREWYGGERSSREALDEAAEAAHALLAALGSRRGYSGEPPREEPA
jgi:uncharacterized protein DUF4129